MCAFKWDRVAGIVNEDIDETTEEFEFGCRVFSRRIVFAYCKPIWYKNKDSSTLRLKNLVILDALTKKN